MKRVALLCLFVLSICVTMMAQPFSFPGSEGAFVGVYIENISTGKVVASYNKDKLFIPASITKCVTAAVAVAKLEGKGPLFSTSVYCMGKVSDGVLRGSLVIVGGGDPTLGSRHFASMPSFTAGLVAAVKDAGIDSIAGSVIMDSGVCSPVGVSPYWLLEDIPWEYGAGLYGINYKDNSFSLSVSSNPNTAFSVVENPYVEVYNSISRDPKASGVVAMRGMHSSELYLSGSTSGATYSSRYSAPFPADMLQTDVVNALARAGIGVGESEDMNDNSQDDITEIFKYGSPSRDDILRTLMFKSNNLYAEGILRALVLPSRIAPFGAYGASREDALSIEKDYLKSLGLDVASVRINDGCGLAINNRVSPLFMAKMLKAAGTDLYVSYFPKVGKDGTVKGLLAKTPLAGKLALKSGSMTGVLCYAGYKLNAKGKPTHTVVIMVNGFTCKTAQVRAAIAKYLQSCF